MFIIRGELAFENRFFVPIILIPVVVVVLLIVTIIAVMVLQMVEILTLIVVCAKHVIIQAVAQIVGKTFALFIITIKKSAKSVERNIAQIGTMIVPKPVNFVGIR